MYHQDFIAHVAFLNRSSLENKIGIDTLYKLCFVNSTSRRFLRIFSQNRKRVIIFCASK